MSIAFLLVISGTLLAKVQEASDAANFHWDWRQWQELSWKQSISRMKRLSAPVRDKLTIAISEQLRPAMADLGIKSESELHEVAASTRVKFVLLGHQAAFVVAQGSGEKSGCSATGNCPFWLFQPVKGEYVVLLEGEAQTFTIQAAKTNGLPDIVLGIHASAFAAELTDYKFDGKKYIPGGCYTATWRELGSDGEYHESREPHVSPCESH